MICNNSDKNNKLKWRYGRASIAQQQQHQQQQQQRQQRSMYYIQS